MVNHISIIKIKEIYPKIAQNNFKFEQVTEEDVKREIQNFGAKKIIYIWLYFSNNLKTIC